jgi:type III restriction enzyme
VTKVAKDSIDKLIINSAFEEPKSYWKYNIQTQSFDRLTGRRPAGYTVATPGANQYNDAGKFIELELANAIRPRVKSWRENGYPGVTGITKKLLEHWHDANQRDYQFFYCQLDAMETLIWLVEAPDSERVGINVPTDGGLFKRFCSKMATGTGKTTVMAMLIAWQVLNKVTYPQNKNYTKNVLIIAPNLTVKSRLQVLSVSGDDNYYTKFNVVPTALREKLRQGRVLIHNWQTLSWDTEERLAKKKTVDKRGVKSDEAYAREVLSGMSSAHNLLVINDEAHHAWRLNPETKVSRDEKKEAEKATVWVGGLDRIHKARNILACYDFSATPFAPSGKKNNEEALFDWIVSDFGLNDAIESGLVKTPRIVIRDDGAPDVQTYKSKLYHLYMADEINADINRSAKPEEPLPDLLGNAYRLLGLDWLEVYKEWQAAGSKIPPVMISVVNRTETAARIKYAFDHKRIEIDELCNPDLTLHIDSKVLEMAESEDDINIGSNSEAENDTDSDETKKMSKKEQAAFLRKTVDTVGQFGEPGEQIRNVISVGMLSEGWDAKTVTHILGLRAFSSQLLCEQVVGRGLRRTSYDKGEDGLFDAEYVNIFGIPFSFLPHETQEGDTAPKPRPPKIQVEPLQEKVEYQIEWPNIIRIDRVLKPELSVDIENIKPLVLDASETRLRADLAAVIDGKTDLTKCTEIDLEKLDKNLRMQRLIFDAASQVYDVMKASWQQAGTKFALFGQVISLVEKFLKSDKIDINPPLFNTTDLRRKIILNLNMNKIVQHLWSYIKVNQTEKIVPVFDANKAILSTGDMNIWYTSKPCAITQHSHISHCVFDSGWEATEAYKLEKSDKVTSWVKNDHLGFNITYIFNGVVHVYKPDFIIRLTNGKMLVLETKGQDSSQNKAKREALNEWIHAVNENGGFGKWSWDVSFNVADVDGIIEKHFNEGAD